MIGSGSREREKDFDRKRERKRMRGMRERGFERKVINLIILETLTLERT